VAIAEALNSAWHDHERLELENDLIAAQFLETGRVPPAQFLGDGATRMIIHPGPSG
jgi:hypothetical protein